MGTDCAPLLSDIFFTRTEFIQSLLKACTYRKRVNTENVSKQAKPLRDMQLALRASIQNANTALKLDRYPEIPNAFGISGR